MTDIDYKQYCKERVLERVKLLGLTDKRVSSCMRFFAKKLLFLSVFESEEKPNDFVKHIALWSLESSDVGFDSYWSELTDQYLGCSDFQICSDRLQSIGFIQGFLYNPRKYALIKGISLKRGDRAKLEALHATVSFQVRGFLAGMQQHLKENSSDILATYQGRSHTHTTLVKTAWKVSCAKKYLPLEEREEKKKGEETKLSADADPDLKKILDIAYGAFISIGEALKIRSRCINHLADVMDLCGIYPDEGSFLAPEDWVDPAVLDEVKVINSLLVNKERYKEFLPDVDQITLNQCYETTTVVIKKVLEFIKKQCAEKLERQKASYKKREAVARDANACSLGLIAYPVTKSSGEEEQQKEGSKKKKSVSWSLSGEHSDSLSSTLRGRSF